MARQSPVTWLMPLGTLIQFMLPRRLVVWLAGIAGRLAYHCARRRRAQLLANQRRLLGPDVSERAVRDSARRAFINLAVNYTDLLRAPVLRRRVTGLARLDCTELDRALAHGRGCILVTAHIGNWDLAGICLSALGYPLSALVEPVPGGWAKTFNRYRELTNLETISMHDQAGIIRAISNRRVLTLVADRDLTGNGLACPAFDARRSYPRGPALLALRYRLPVVVGCFAFSHEPGQPPYIGIVEPAIAFTRTGNPRQDIDELTRRIATGINRILARFPDQWLVFEGGWQ